ncbi:MAG: DUF350 domain-containing protein [Armatimonadetes bacterium]|nr:DUF350 domain-containing protein [Armatimonadota bacterium]
MPTGEAAAHGLSATTIGASILYALLGVILMLIAYRIFDWLHHVDFDQELKNGNMAAGVAVAGVLIGVAIIVAAAIV